jgi:hypothetical protein
MSHPENIEETLESIAKRKLGVSTLKTRNSDQLDFHDIHVVAIKEALLTAYKAGISAQLTQEDDFVIYSPNESAVNDGDGFWSNEQGWGSFDGATVFTKLESETMNLPIATGDDARWVPALQAKQSYSTTPPSSPSP